MLRVMSLQMQPASFRRPGHGGALPRVAARQQTKSHCKYCYPMTDPLGKLNEYELRHIVSHLVVISASEMLDRLLRLETSNRLNALFEAKAAHRDATGYVEDIRLALYHAKDIQ